MLQWHAHEPAVGLHDTLHTTHHTRHMITYEWKIEWHDGGEIVDTDHFETLPELLDAAETDSRPCQVCLVRKDGKNGTQTHLYFAERGRFDEDNRQAPPEIVSEIAHARTRIGALLAAGIILTDDQIGSEA